MSSNQWNNYKNIYIMVAYVEPLPKMLGSGNKSIEFSGAVDDEWPMVYRMIEKK
ncbi:MAG: hypothetical protein ACFFG0_57045 [Candidatus Thorarchaeota archaeon]